MGKAQTTTEPDKGMNPESRARDRLTLPGDF
jgi:hypothetical protein